MGSRPDNYFKVVTSLARAIDLIFIFDSGSESDTRRAWDAARDAAATLQAGAAPELRIAAWRRPVLPGPWSKVQVVA